MGRSISDENSYNMSSLKKKPNIIRKYEGTNHIVRTKEGCPSNVKFVREIDFIFSKPTKVSRDRGYYNQSGTYFMLVVAHL